MRIGNLKGIVLPQYNFQQIISQCVEDTSFMMRAKETSVINLVGYLYKFRIASGLEINWHKMLLIGASKDYCQDGWRNNIRSEP